ncbi:hypothetical protein BGZ47_004843 [Haplosporangium gracile]|nr:hypothetical protein BGZ47_004843 [Haplosporangium gracile]
MPAPDYDQQQQEQLFLAPTLVSYDNNEEDYDDLSNLDDQFMTMEITPYDWPQDLYQTHQPDEALDTETTSFFADSSGSTVFFSDSTASPYGYYNHNSHCNYCDGYDYYDDNDHYDSIGGLIHVFDTPTTPAEYNNPSSSSGPRPQL